MHGLCIAHTDCACTQIVCEKVELVLQWFLVFLALCVHPLIHSGTVRVLSRLPGRPLLWCTRTEDVLGVATMSSLLLLLLVLRRSFVLH